MSNREQKVDPRDIYGDQYHEDNRGKQLSFNKQAVKGPKPFGQEGRGVEVKEADAYEDDLEDKLSKMLNRNKHTNVLDSSAKAKHDCARCSAKVTEDDKWVTACEKTFHLRCFTCVDCNAPLQKEPKYFEKNGQPQCPKCERGGASECGQCHKPFASEDASVKALNKVFHPQCFFCAGCGHKFATAANAEDRKFREKAGRPYCEKCYSK